MLFYLTNIITVFITLSFAEVGAGGGQNTLSIDGIRNEDPFHEELHITLDWRNILSSFERSSDGSITIIQVNQVTALRINDSFELVNETNISDMSPERLSLHLYNSIYSGTLSLVGEDEFGKYLSLTFKYSGSGNGNELVEQLNQPVDALINPILRRLLITNH